MVENKCCIVLWDFAKAPQKYQNLLPQSTDHAETRPGRWIMQIPESYVIKWERDAYDNTPVPVFNVHGLTWVAMSLDAGFDPKYVRLTTGHILVFGRD